MIRVNEQPIDMVEQTKTMCAAPSMVYGPHYDPGVVYYINKIARQGLGSYSDKKLFPVGSIIVKEKQERRTEDSVQIITVMKKVQEGSGEDSWEYKMYDTKKWAEIGPSGPEASLVLSHPATAASARTTPTDTRRTCLGCHRHYKDNDYVSDRGIALLLGR